VISFCTRVQDAAIEPCSFKQLLSLSALLSPRPNPFNPRTEVRFSLEREGLVQVVVYDVRGRRVRTLASGSLAAGLHALTWQGIDDRGGSVASGVYFLKMEFGGQVMTRRMTLVR